MKLGYRIVYDGRAGKYEVKEDRSFRFWMLTGVMLLLTLLFWKEGREYIQEALIPGDNETTIGALKNMTSQLRQGSGLRDAVVTFCNEVIHGTVSAN